MVTKHFFKILATFILLIILGLAGVMTANRVENEKREAAAAKTQEKTPPSKPCVGKNC